RGHPRRPRHPHASLAPPALPAAAPGHALRTGRLPARPPRPAGRRVPAAGRGQREGDAMTTAPREPGGTDGEPRPGDGAAGEPAPGGGPAVPVFLYHAVMDDPPDWIAEFTVTPRQFAAHLDAVVDSGRTPATLSALAGHLARRAPLPPRPVPPTFRDGFRAHAGMDHPPDWIAEFTVTPRQFAAHLDAVVDSGRPPVTISALAGHLAGRAPLPPRPVLLTFDDGFADLPGPTAEALAARAL